MFVKGLICGVLASALNFLVLYFTMKYFVSKSKKLARFTFAIFYVLRYGGFGALIYVFLKYKWGSPLGLLAGISIGLVLFVILRRSLYDGLTGSC